MNPSLLKDHFFSPKNVGDLGDHAYRGTGGSTLCGAVVRVSIQVDQSQTITAAKFKAAGCDLLVATASLLTESILDKTTAEASELTRHAVQLETSLNEDGNNQGTCAKLVGEALLSAISEYSDSVRQEWDGDESLICTCFCVSERTIETEIQRGHLSTVREVTKACNAGGGCQSCWPLIEDMLAVERAAR